MLSAARDRPSPSPLLALGALSWAFAVTAARAIRWPNDWAEGHWLISYELGFLKRALPGTLILPLRRLLGPDHTENLVTTVSALAFAAFSVAFGTMLYRILRNHRFRADSVLLVLVVATSSYVVMAAHLMGYFDHVLVVLTVAACACVLRGRTIWAAGIVCLGLLVHETIFFVGYPSVLFTALLADREPAAGLAGRLKLWLPLLALPPLALLGLIAYQSFFLDADVVRTELREHLARFAFVRRRRDALVALAFTTSFVQYLQGQSVEFWDRLTSFADLRSKIGPLLALLPAAGIGLRAHARSPWLLAALVAITFAPLLLLLVAFDTGRIWAYPILVAVVGVWAIGETAPQPLPAVPGRALALLVALLVANCLLTTELMDRLDERFAWATRLLLYVPVLYVAVHVAVMGSRREP